MPSRGSHGESAHSHAVPRDAPPWSQVGPWRVMERAGRGVHGAVYRAVRIGQEHAPPVALKLALFPRDPRFAHEVELLSRQLHPHIPRLIDHGEWEHPDGTLHPYMNRGAAPAHYTAGPADDVYALGQRSDASTSLRAQLRSWRHWLAAGAAGLALAMWVRGLTPGDSAESASVAQEETAEADQPDAGPVGLGDAAVSAATGDTSETLGPKVMADETLPEPQPEQARPDTKGRCPRKRQVALNGGCWIGFSLDQEGCAELNGRMYKGSCYVPIIPPGRSPTSSPTDQP